MIESITKEHRYRIHFHKYRNSIYSCDEKSRAINPQYIENKENFKDVIKLSKVLVAGKNENCK